MNTLEAVESDDWIEEEGSVERDARRILINARKLLEKGWCQRAAARDANGIARHFTAKSVESFCLIGAMGRAAYDLRLMTRADLGVMCPEFWRAYERLTDETVRRPSVWNDEQGRPQAEVLRLVDTAIGGK